MAKYIETHVSFWVPYKNLMVEDNYIMVYGLKSFETCIFKVVFICPFSTLLFRSLKYFVSVFRDNKRSYEVKGGTPL